MCRRRAVSAACSDRTMDDCIIRTFKYRLRTTARDRCRLEKRKQEYRDLYNAVVQERESYFRANQAERIEGTVCPTRSGSTLCRSVPLAA